MFAVYVTQPTQAAQQRIDRYRAGLRSGQFGSRQLSSENADPMDLACRLGGGPDRAPDAGRDNEMASFHRSIILLAHLRAIRLR
jgi:hypothetical protein